MKTICVISTPMTQSAIAIVRMSGADSINILSKCFVPVGKTKVQDFAHSKLYLGDFHIDCDGNEFCDRCLAVVFRSPMSYTGENMVEIQCHGSIAVQEGIIKTLLKNGGNLAQRGEFSKRAFLNGKMDLSEAEGVCDLIFAENEAYARASSELASGVLYKKISTMQAELLDILSEFEVLLDYPEEEIEQSSQQKIFDQISLMNNTLAQLERSFDIGKKYRNGIRVVLCGKTNVGKSTLFNALLGTDKAIVTEIEGTTRDVLEAEMKYNGVNFLLIDTAGVRNSTNKIEQIGIEKTRKQIESADIILNVVFGEKDEEIEKLIENKNCINIYSKGDIIDKKDENKFYISAKSGENMQNLMQKIYDKTIGQKVENGLTICNLRHYDAICESKRCAEDILQDFFEKQFDVLALQIKTFWQALGVVTGSTATEEIIDNIFAKFCLGK